MTAQEERTFRYNSPRSEVVGDVFFAVMCFLLAMMYWWWLSRLAWGHDTTMSSNPKYLVLQAILMTFACGQRVCLLRRALDERHGAVKVDQDGLKVLGTRTKNRRLKWSEIKEIRVGSYAISRPPPARIIAHGRPLSLSARIVDRPDLIDEIISRAGLEKTSEGWWKTVYKHPESATDVVHG